MSNSRMQASADNVNGMSGNTSSSMTAIDYKAQADTLSAQADQLSKAAQWAYSQGNKSAGDAYQQAATDNYYAAQKASLAAVNMNAASQASIPTSSSTSPFAPGWNTGDYSAGMSAPGRAAIPDTTFQFGAGANAASPTGGIVGLYEEAGIAVGVGKSGISINAYKMEGIVTGPQQGASIGVVESIGQGLPSPGTTVYNGITAFGGDGIVGNVTVLSDSDKNLSVGRASGRLAVGEAVGGGTIRATQTTYPIFNWKF